MHVVHVNLSREYRGGELQTIALIEALAADRTEADLRQTVIVRAGSRFHYRCADLEGVDVRPVRASVISAALAGMDADIVHVHDGRSPRVGALLSLAGIPFVITRRVPNRPKGWFLTRWVYSRAARIVCVSDHVAGVMRDASDSSRVVIVYDCARHPVITGELAKTGHGASLRVAAIGAIDFAHKGQDLLAKAAWNLADQGMDVGFVVAGTGRDEDNLIAMTHGLASFRVLGWVDDISGLLADIDVLVHPSRKEGLGAVILEAMMAGRPVVAADVGGIPEIVVDEQNGLLIMPRSPLALQEAIARLASNRDLVRQLGRNAARTAMAHLPRRMARQYMDVYGQALAARQPRPA